MMRILPLLVLLFATPCMAQIDSTSKPPSRMCWRGKPAPECSSFWLTEVSAEYAFASTTTQYYVYNGSGNSMPVGRANDISSRLVWTVGPMFNTSRSRALGGTLSLGFGNDGSRLSIEARRRWWTPDGTTFDASAGFLRSGVPYSQDSRSSSAYGVTAGVYVIGGDLFHVTGHGDLLLSGGRVRSGATAGVGLGSYPAVGATLLLGAVTLLVIVAFVNSDFGE